MNVYKIGRYYESTIIFGHVFALVKAPNPEQALAVARGMNHDEFTPTKQVEARSDVVHWISDEEDE